MVQRQKGMTLLELIVVVVILAILTAILAPVLLRAREESRRATCRDRLRQIGMGCIMYSYDWNEWYPTSGVNLPEGRQESLRALSQLCCCYASARHIFVCPSTNDTPDVLVMRNHRPLTPMTPKGCSYAYDPLKANIYDKPVRFSVIILADKPAATNGAKRNSANHGFEGQNVLYYGGNVKWQTSIKCGIKGDNIYTGKWTGPGNALPTTDTCCTMD